MSEAFDILAEQDRGRLPPQTVLEWFTARDVNGLSLAKSAWGEYDFVKLDDIVLLTHGTFEFARYSKGKAAETACTFVVRNFAGDPQDIVAWQVEAGRVATWLGAAALMGEEELYGPSEGDGLVVHPGPLSWFQTARQGVVIINKKRAAPMLREAQPLIAASVSHGEELQELLRMPPPRILVATQSNIREAA